MCKGGLTEVERMLSRNFFNSAVFQTRPDFSIVSYPFLRVIIFRLHHPFESQLDSFAYAQIGGEFVFSKMLEHRRACAL